MYRESFPKCEITGDQTPSSMLNHMGSEFAVPKKCLNCNHLFEGECTRSIDQKDGYLRVDTGNCGITGSSDPVIIKTSSSGNKIFVPTKCKECQFLHLDAIRKYVCKKDNHLWGDGFRDLDWGEWTPDYPNVGLRKSIKQEKYTLSLGQAIITESVVKLIQEGEKIKALKLYRKLNSIETLKEAKTDIDILEVKIKNT